MPKTNIDYSNVISRIWH